MTTLVFGGGGASLGVAPPARFNCIPLLERVEMLPGPAVSSQEGSKGFHLQSP